MQKMWALKLKKYLCHRRNQKRSTKANAIFSGFGIKKKEINLYDP